MNLTDRNFSRLVLGALTLGFVALAAAGAMATWTVSRNQDHARLVEHAYQIDATIGRFQIQLERAETARRGYLLAQSDLFTSEYGASTSAAVTELNRLGSLIRDPSQHRRHAQLRNLTRLELSAMRTSMELARRGDLGRAQAMFDEKQSVRALLDIRTLSEEMTTAQNALLALRSLNEQASLLLLYLTLGGAGLLVLIVALGSAWAIRRYTSDLAGSRDDLRHANADLEGAVDDRTADLSRANEEIQRFAYIVSHDLRSPLVNVLGFTAELDSARVHLAALIDRVEAEAPHLLDDPARLAAREDLPEAVGFIRASTQKMDRLINSILKLSREGRRTLTPEQLPMDKLLDDIGASFEQQLRASGGRLLVNGPLPDLVSDRVAVEQIFSNLIENAVKYGASDAPLVIEVAGRTDGRRVIYEVSDNGRGIDPRDHQRIFDLFRRSGKQDKPGEGLGLAHVRALAYRLGGLIDVHSVLGAGATFRLTLPTIYRERETTR